MRTADCFQHNVFFYLVSASFDHNDFFLGTSNGQLQFGYFALFFIWADNDFAVNQTGLNTSDRAIPWNVGDGQCEGSTQHTSYFRAAVLINRENGHNNSYVVSHIFWEQWADRTVNHAGRENCFGGWAAFTFQEGAWDAAYCVEFFFEVNRQREEVDAFAWFLGSGYVYHNGGFAVAYNYAAVGQTAPFTGFKSDFFAGQFGFKYSEIFKHTDLPPFLREGKGVCTESLAINPAAEFQLFDSLLKPVRHNNPSS